MSGVKTVRQTDQAAPWVVRLGGGFLDRRVVVRSKRHRHPHRRGGGLDLAVEQGSVSRHFPDTAAVGRDLPPLGGSAATKFDRSRLVDSQNGKMLEGAASVAPGCPLSRA